MSERPKVNWPQEYMCVPPRISHQKYAWAKYHLRVDGYLGRPIDLARELGCKSPCPLDEAIDDPKELKRIVELYESEQESHD